MNTATQQILIFCLTIGTTLSSILIATGQDTYEQINQRYPASEIKPSPSVPTRPAQKTLTGAQQPTPAVKNPPDLIPKSVRGINEQVQQNNDGAPTLPLIPVDFFSTTPNAPRAGSQHQTSAQRQISQANQSRLSSSGFEINTEQYIRTAANPRISFPGGSYPDSAGVGQNQADQKTINPIGTALNAPVLNSQSSNDSTESLPQPPVTRQNTPVQLSGNSKQVTRTPPVEESSSHLKTDNQSGQAATIGTTQFKLAEQPGFGEHYFHDAPVNDPRSIEIPAAKSDFNPDPIPHDPYDSENEKWLYSGKQLNANQRPLVELGRPWYQLGQLSEPSTVLGFHNPIASQFLIFGDFRTAAAANSVAGDSSTQLAFELNLNFHYQITSTERFLFSASPLDRGDNTRYLFDDDQFVDRFDPNINFGFFEGDLGAIVGGVVGETLPFDLPIAIGFMPMLVQNGIWMDDAFVGIAATIPARNSPLLDISNMDVTFMWAFDEVTSPAFEGDDDAAQLYGIISFIEALGGYFEIDYAYLEDRSSFRNRSYHNMGFAFTRRYGRWISNSVRVIANAGQSTMGGPNSADGTVILIENSLITSQPSTFIPYLNLFAGFDRPQSVARSAQAGGILHNTGILFESDGMTGYPTLDASAHDTWGGAVGLNMLAQDFSQQLIVEAAMLQVMNGPTGRNAIDHQYGVGARYQIPLSNSWIFRTDAMYGHFRNTDDVHGVRLELRKKF